MLAVAMSPEPHILNQIRGRAQAPHAGTGEGEDGRDHRSSLVPLQVRTLAQNFKPSVLRFHGADETLLRAEPNFPSCGRGSSGNILYSQLLILALEERKRETSSPNSKPQNPKPTTQNPHHKWSFSP